MISDIWNGRKLVETRISQHIVKGQNANPWRRPFIHSCLAGIKAATVHFEILEQQDVCLSMKTHLASQEAFKF
jgi:hypothetical protein